MFATIRRHQKWLWFVVIFGVIVPFVWFMNPTSGYGRGGGRGAQFTAYVNGRAVGNEEVSQAYSEARLQFFLYAQAWPEENPQTRQLFDANRQLTERLLLIEKLREYRISASDQEIADWIARLFKDRQRGTFNLDLYRSFIDRSLRSAGLTEEDFRRFARHQVGIQHLFTLGELSGSLVTPREAELQFRREQEQITAQVAAFSLSNHLAEVLITPEAIDAWFAAQAARYRVPEKVSVTYVQFAATSFLAEADQLLAQRTNLSLELDAIYRQQGPDTFRDSAGQTLTPEAAKEQIKSERRTAFSQLAARRKANAFAEELIALHEKEPGAADPLSRLAAAQQLKAVVTEPFSRFERPAGLQTPAEFSSVAFQLTTNQPFASQPIVTPEAVYVIGLKEHIPSRAPALDEVRQTVTADYRRSEARRIALEAARKFHAALQAGLAQGQTFEQVCASANVTPIKAPTFARSANNLPGLSERVDFTTLRNVAVEVATGKCSDVAETRDGAIVVHVASRQPVDEARVKAELAEYLSELRMQQRQDAVGEWLRKELELAQISGLPEVGERRNRSSAE